MSDTAALASLAEIMATYAGSNGDHTRALYDALEARGPIGVVATNLFRACKASERAKGYRGGIRGRGSFKSMAYQRKGWAIDNLVQVLTDHAEQLGLVWGWGKDDATPGFSWVLYVEVPAGQVSFHSPARGQGPDYASEWDGERGQSPVRACKFCAQVLGAEVLA